MLLLLGKFQLNTEKQLTALHRDRLERNFHNARNITLTDYRDSSSQLGAYSYEHHNDEFIRQMLFEIEARPLFNFIGRGAECAPRAYRALDGEAIM